MISKSDLARDIFVTVMSSAENLGGIDKVQRNILGTEAARICFELAEAFMEVYYEKEDQDDF